MKRTIRFMVVAVMLASIAGVGYAQEESEARILSYDEAFLTYFKKMNKQPNADDIDVYMATKYEDEYDESRRNEFALRRLRIRVTEEVTQQMKEYAIAKQYVVVTSGRSLQLDKYDFNKNMFSLYGFYGYQSVEGAGGDADIMVLFSNADQFKWLPIDLDTAEAFLQSRMNWAGNPDTTVVLLIFFKIGENNTAFTKQVTEKRFNGKWYFLNGVIDRVEVWDQMKNVKIGELVK